MSLKSVHSVRLDRKTVDLDLAFSGKLEERAHLLREVKARIGAMEILSQQKRYLELQKKVTDRVILTCNELEEFVLLRQGLDANVQNRPTELP